MHETNAPELPQVNVVAGQHLSSEEADVDIQKVEAAEMDEMWRVVGEHAQPRW